MTPAQVLHANPWFSVIATRVADQAWYRVERADSAMVVGTTPEGAFLMLRGKRDTTGPASLLEFPCGGAEPGESFETAAVRETLEESGYLASNLRCVGSVVESPGISSSTCHIYIADVAIDRPAALEAGEDWETEIVTLDELRQHIRDGNIRDGGSLAAAAIVLSLGA